MRIERTFAFGLIALFSGACSSPNGDTTAAEANVAPKVESTGALSQAANGPLTWKGFTWTPTSGGMAGVANGDPANVSIDASGYLHLKIAKNGNTWTAAEVFTTTSLGFGTYQWQIAGPIDRMDHTVVLGLYPYGPAAGIGGDGTNEIDTEFSFWNDELGKDNVDFGVYPPTTAGTHWEKDFAFSLNGGSATTARMVWSAKGITGTLFTGFEPIGGTSNVIATYAYAPTNPTVNVPQQALPLGMNLWCYKGIPSSGQNVEIVIQDFQFVPEGQSIDPPDASTDSATDTGTDAANPIDSGSVEPDAGADHDAGTNGAIDSGSVKGKDSGSGAAASPDSGDGSTDSSTGCAVRSTGHDDTNAFAVAIFAIGIVAGARRRRVKAGMAAATSCIALAAVGCGSDAAVAIDGGGNSDPTHSGSDAGGSTKSDGGKHTGSDGAASGDDDGDDDGSAPPSPGDDSGAAHDGSGSLADGGISSGSTILVPAQGALLGHFYGDGTLAASDARIGRKPAIHLTYYSWDEDWTKNDTPSADFADGRIPLVNWEPDNINFDDIISGKLDATIQARAAGSKALGKQFFLDFAAEMNGDEGWGGNNPAKYISAYRHIHDIFTNGGATNVVWAWCPNVTDIENGAPTMDYYPGDTYVDWTGVDGYNWGTSDKNFEWQSFHDVFADIYPKLAAKGKPILIGEMASDEVGGDKGQWIDGIIPALKTNYPLIKAFVWFDIHKERQWQVNSSAGSLAAYKRMANDPFMNP